MTYTPAVAKDIRNRYAQHAAPESIKANLRRVELAARQVADEIEWLQGLLRDREVGIWPGLSTEGEA